MDVWPLDIIRSFGFNFNDDDDDEEAAEVDDRLLR